MKDAREQPIQIIIKKKASHGHHGGAWKVAFADFMTAMMAMFLVLWLVNQSSEVKSAIAGYFQDPLGHPHERGESFLPSAGGFDRMGPMEVPAVDMRREQLRNFAEKLRATLGETSFSGLSNSVSISLVDEGLRIEMMDGARGAFFAAGALEPNTDATQWLGVLGRELSLLPNMIAIEGHTDASPFTMQPGLSNWELSTSRANASRRIMEDGGLRPTQVSQVRGFADRRPLDSTAPTSAENRRVSIMVLFDQSDVFEWGEDGTPIPIAEPAPGEESGE